MRKVKSLDSEWLFHKGDTKKNQPPKKIKKDWQSINLPHNWNVLANKKDCSETYRGRCWYFKEIDIPFEKDEEVYIEIPCASLFAQVYVNRCLVCTHKGGFSAFRANITSYIKKKKTTQIAICVDNSEIDDIYPHKADFAIFGGLYQGVKLITVNKAHFDLDYYGGSGVIVTPRVSDDNTAEIYIEAFVKNADDYKIQYRLDGIVVSGQKVTLHIGSPHFWNGKIDPYLYTLEAQLVKDNIVIDNVSVKFGIRNIRIDSCKGFYLNNKPYEIRGVSSYQDRENIGWALSEAEQKDDIELIVKMGANAIRLANYQHSEYFYNLCDEYGILVCAEIPFTSEFINTANGKENALSQMKELIIQNYNHPSIICWGIANNINSDITPELVDNLNSLNKLCHSSDKSRPTTMALPTSISPQSPINRITDVITYNTHFGDAYNNTLWLDRFHTVNPDICVGLSEYGCEGVVNYCNDTFESNDNSEDYQASFHEEMLNNTSSREFLWSTYAWNMFDFSSVKENNESTINNSGLISYDRKVKKDSYFIYKAYWSDEKFIHICSSRNNNRKEETTSIKIYSNCDSVKLIVNSAEFATKPCDKVVIFNDVPLQNGENTISAVNDNIADEIKINNSIIVNESFEAEEETIKEDELPLIEDIAIQNENSDIALIEDIAIQNENSDVALIEPTEPDEYFSTSDKVSDIISVPQGKQLFNELLLKITSESGINISTNMINMAKNFTVEKLFDMAGTLANEDAKAEIRSAVAQIKKTANNQ